MRLFESFQQQDGMETEVTASAENAAAMDSPSSVFQQLTELDRSDDAYATRFVKTLFDFGLAIKTSDVHLQPAEDKFDVHYRVNGVLEHLGSFPAGTSTSITSRLKVMAGLLTYVRDLPQEGRILKPDQGVEIRVSTFPTLHGERVALRFFGCGQQFERLEQLGHDPEVLAALEDALDETSGALLVTGPAGSGKSTTLFASLRRLVEQNRGARCLMSLEDPIEVPLAGVSQSQVNLAAGFDLPTGLRSLLRQDPEVIMIGEIRDSITAEIAIQASLTGQLMLTTFHADSVAASISRLIDLGIDPYLIRSGLVGIVSQRLLRRLCPECHESSEDRDDFYGLPIEQASIARGCQACHETGYKGRVLVSEFLSLRESGLVDELLAQPDSRSIYRTAMARGMKSLWERATELVRERQTSPSEVRRVLGVSMRI